MLQQDLPEDYVIATGRQHSVRDFVELAARALGIEVAWQGEGVHERGMVASVNGDKAPGVVTGQPIVAVDPQYFRPTEVETLLGDPGKARRRLGWEPRISFEAMVQEMVTQDLDSARRHQLLASHGYNVAISLE
jgi:GDPmannose 4,6-dehydratase